MDFGFFLLDWLFDFRIFWIGLDFGFLDFFDFLYRILDFQIFLIGLDNYNHPEAENFIAFLSYSDVM